MPNESLEKSIDCLTLKHAEENILVDEFDRRPSANEKFEPLEIAR